VLESLFADRPEARRLVAPPGPPSPREVVLRYNLALLQGILLRAIELDVCARSNVRSVVRFAKLRGLLCTYHPLDDGIRIAHSGPLAVLRETTKYGHALAAFVPAAVATPGWTIDARCPIGGQLLRLRATGSDPIASTHALPKDCDSAVERALARQERVLRRRRSLLTADVWTRRRCSRQQSASRPRPPECAPAPRRSLGQAAKIRAIKRVRMSDLAPEERAWIEANEARWRRAHEIAARNPSLDAGDVYHVLATWHETPTQRVRRSLAHARLRSRGT